MKYRRSPRLKDFDYFGPLAAHITVVTRLRKPLLADPDLAELCVRTLQNVCEQFSTDLKAYCVMPDHIHFLVSIPEGTSLKELVRRFKQKAGFELKQKLTSSPWQISYYDHILRREESIEDVARYIWHNPVREGLVENLADYEFLGPKELIAQT